MSEFENKEAIELSLEEMNEVAGGYKPLAPKKGYIVYQIAKGDTLRKIADKFKPIAKKNNSRVGYTYYVRKYLISVVVFVEKTPGNSKTRDYYVYNVSRINGKPYSFYAMDMAAQPGLFFLSPEKTWIF